ncbi:MAG: hypothetical protein VX589_03265, partial [Myxococcota bacterium]|nr:hypothetical protein [Myxococcota bacterium]
MHPRTFQGLLCINRGLYCSTDSAIGIVMSANHVSAMATRAMIVRQDADTVDLRLPMITSDGRHPLVWLMPIAFTPATRT